MKKIDLTPCSEDCSKWELQVKCNSSKKIGQISIQFCFTKNFYLVDVTSFEGECKMNTEETQEMSKDKIEKLCTDNFKIIHNSGCIEYTEKEDYCPECNDSVEAGLEHLD
jgi:hypothetical protein